VKDKTYSERDAQAESALKFLNQEQYISVNTLKGSLVGFSSSHALFYFLFFYFFLIYFSSSEFWIVVKCEDIIYNILT
jgi:hypothetical protein